MVIEAQLLCQLPLGQFELLPRPPNGLGNGHAPAIMALQVQLHVLPKVPSVCELDCLTSAKFGQGLISPKLWFPIARPS